MQIIAANWDHAHTGERPLNDHTGLARRRSRRHRRHRERARAPTGAAAWGAAASAIRRRGGRSTERSTANGLAIDGGRTIRGGGEHFTIHVDPAKPTRLVLRTGGQPSYGWHEAIKKPVEMTLYAGTKKLGSLTIAPPAGAFSELTFNIAPHALPTGEVEIHSEATGMYRVFHWFVLQPE